MLEREDLRQAMYFRSDSDFSDLPPDVTSAQQF